MLEDLLKEVLQGAQSQSGRKNTQQPQGGDILSEVIKGVLGGQGGAKAQPSGGLGDILGSVIGVLGGGDTTRGGGSGGGRVPDTTRGGGTGGGNVGANNPIVNIVANLLAERLGISPQIARTVVSFALALLMNKAANGQTRSAQGSGAVGGQDFDLDDLLEGDYAWESGLAQKLSAETGLSEDEAAYNLQEAVVMLTEGPAAQAKKQKKQKRTQPQAAPAKSGLDSLLDNWQVD